MTIIHSLFDGRQDEIDSDVLFSEGLPETGDVSGVVDAGNSFAVTIKEALADHYDRSTDEFSNYEVVLEPNGNITVRPKAVFGI